MSETQIIKEVKKQVQSIVEEYCHTGNGFDAGIKLLKLNELLWCVEGSEETRDMISNLKNKITYLSIQQRDERNNLFKD